MKAGRTDDLRFAFRGAEGENYADLDSRVDLQPNGRLRYGRYFGADVLMCGSALVMADEMDRCYDCACRIPEGTIVRVEEYFGNGVRAKISLCSKCARNRYNSTFSWGRVFRTVFLGLVAFVLYIYCRIELQLF